MPEFLVIILGIFAGFLTALIHWYQKQLSQLIQDHRDILEVLEQERVLRATIEFSYNKQITQYKIILKELGVDVNIQKDVH